MNQIVEAVRNVFIPQPAVKDLRADLERAESRLPGAKVALATARSQHEAQALELMSRADGGASLARSRASVDDASDLVSDLESAILTARKRLEAATDADEASALAEAWDRAAALQDRRIAAWDDSQAKLDAWVATLEPLKRLNEEAYAALPVRPDFRPSSSTPSGMAALIDLYLHGASGGWLGKLGVSPHLARMRPTLGSTARDLAKRLLAADQRKEKK